MMKKATLFGAILSAAMITAAGVALAADPQPAVDSGTSGAGTGGVMNQAPASPGVIPGAILPSVPSTAAVLPELPPASAVGKNVTNTEGAKIGEISKVLDDRVVVEVGGFLGIGSRDVALPWSQIKATGSGDDMTLQTTLTKDEIKSMPDYIE